MKKVVAAACALLVVAGAAFAQAPAKFLDQKKLDKFLADFPKISAAGQEEGLAVQGASESSAAAAMAGPPAAGTSISKAMRDGMNAMKQNPEARKLLAKYGWDDSFWDTLFVVGVSLAVIQMEEGFEGQTIPAEMKPFVDDIRGAVHPSDVALVKKDRARVETVFTAE